MNRTFIFALIVSLLIHLGVVFFSPKLFSGKSTTGSDGGGASSRVETISAFIENAAVEKNEGKGNGPSALTDACRSKKFYTGIGVIMGLNSSVASVALGAPGDRAGIKAGDIITNADILTPNKYPVGTEITLNIVRAQEKKTIAVRIDKVCFED